MANYSIPNESRKLLVNGILKHPLHNDLPSECFSSVDAIEFSGTSLPSIPINWRFAESISALKGFEACMVNAYLAKRFGRSPRSVQINTDHAQLLFMSAVLVDINPDESGDITTTGLRDMNDKWANYFTNGDLYKANSSLYRRAAFNIYKTKDGRFFHIHGSLNPNHTLEALDMPLDMPEITNMDESYAPLMQRVSKITSEELDYLLNEQARQAATICLTAEEYTQSEHGRANANMGLYKVDGVPSLANEPCWSKDERFNDETRPLFGLKVLDLTRVIAGPSITRGLAELGASVMRVTAPHNPDISGLHPDLNWGKWNSYLDLRKEDDRSKMRDLILQSDIVVNGYRPGVLDKYGFGENDVVQLISQSRKQGIIYIKENCYGWQGPLAGRSGWQPISDAHTGISWGFGKAMGVNEPVTPVFPNSDYCTGVIGVCAAIHALILRGTKGGSYVIKMALNYYNSWLAETVGCYPNDVWNAVWDRNGRQVFRHYHSANVTLPKYCEMLKENARDTLLRKEYFETRDTKALGLKVRCVKPLLKFGDHDVVLGYNVGTRGNGLDKAEWPNDPMVEVVR